MIFNLAIAWSAFCYGVFLVLMIATLISDDYWKDCRPSNWARIVVLLVASPVSLPVILVKFCIRERKLIREIFTKGA